MEKDCGNCKNYHLGAQPSRDYCEATHAHPRTEREHGVIASILFNHCGKRARLHKPGEPFDGYAYLAHGN